MQSLKNFWETPIYLPYLHESLTDKMIKDFEQKIGYKLPASLIELLKIQNGGYVRYSLPETPPMQLWGIGKKYPSLTVLANELDEEEYGEFSFSLEGLIAFDGDGHYYLCLDYRENKDNPQVSYIDIECDEEEIIADNFDEFLNMLTLKTDDLYVIKSELPLSEVVQLFENVLKIKFDEPDFFDYGYENYQAKFGGDWLFLSPNKVPLAFAREGENNFNLLENYKDKTTSRFPEINTNYSILIFYKKELFSSLKEKLNGILDIVKLSDITKN